MLKRELNLKEYDRDFNIKIQYLYMQVYMQERNKDDGFYQKYTKGKCMPYNFQSITFKSQMLQAIE